MLTRPTFLPNKGAIISPEINKHATKPGTIREILLAMYSKGFRLVTKLLVTSAPLRKKKTITAIWPEYVLPRAT